MELSINGARVLATIENVPLFGTIQITQTLTVSWLVLLIISALCIWLGSGLKVTTARYFTPSGECIHEIGITPHVPIELDEEVVTLYGINNLPHDQDAQLQKAIELIRNGEVK